MPGQLQEVRTRIKSVQSSQQMTKAMKMVSAAKLRRAQDSILQMRPYAVKLQEMLSNIIASLQGGAALSLGEERPVEKVLLIVITSDRGLAGGYNSNLVKLTKEVIATKFAEQNAKGNVTIWNIGKKGYEALTNTGYKTKDTYKDLLTSISFDKVQEAAQAAVKAFTNKEFDKVEIIYSQFKNAATLLQTEEAFLPIPKIENKEKKDKDSNIDFIFEPSKEELVATLVPKILNTQLYKAVLDANASEHGARMTAMDKASNNAGEILKHLKITYNRARQAAITTELTEIVSGAAALEG